MEGHTLRAHHGSGPFDKDVGSQSASHLEFGGDGAAIFAEQVRSSGWYTRRDVVSNLRH